MLEELFGIPDEWVPLLVAAGLLFVVSAFFPIIYPAYAIARHHAPVPRRLLLIATVCAQTYGFLLLFVYAIALPVQVYLILIAPQLAISGYPVGTWLVHASDFIGSWWFILFPMALVAWTIGVTRYLLPRWSRIVDALHG